MKKILKEISIYSMPFLGIVILLIFINIVKRDFVFGHFLHSTYKPTYNWFYDYTIIPLNKFFLEIKNDRNVYLPQIKLYVIHSKLNS